MNRLSSLNPALASLRTTMRSRSRGRRLEAREQQQTSNESSNGNASDDDNANDEGNAAVEEEQPSEEDRQPRRQLGSERIVQAADVSRGADGKLPHSPPDQSRSTSDVDDDAVLSDGANKNSSRSTMRTGRSRSRVRMLLERGGIVAREKDETPTPIPAAEEKEEDVQAKQGSNEYAAAGTSREAAAEPTEGQYPSQISRGRSRSRVRRLLLSRGPFGSSSVPDSVVDAPQAEEPSTDADDGTGPQERPEPPRRSRSSGARRILQRLTSRSTIHNEDEPADVSARAATSANPKSTSVNRAKSLSRRVDAATAARPQKDSKSSVKPELKQAQQPLQLPIQSDIILDTPESRKVMRNISRLGMEDPVLRKMRLDDLNGASAAAATRAGAGPGPGAGQPPVGVEQDHDPSGASFSERMSQHFDDLVITAGPLQGSGTHPHRRPTAAVAVSCLDECCEAESVTHGVDDDDDDDDGATVRSDPTASSQNDGIDMIKFRRALHRTPSTRGGQGRGQGQGIEKANDEGSEKASELRKPQCSKTPSTRHLKEEIEVSPQRRRDSVNALLGLRLEDFQAALHRHQQQQQQQHEQQHQLIHNSTMPTDPRLLNGRDMLDDDSSDPIEAAMPSYMLNGGGAPYSPRTPKYDSLGSTSSLHSARGKSRLDPNRMSKITSLDSVSMHSQSTVEASTSTVEVCNSAYRQQQQVQRRKGQQHPHQHQSKNSSSHHDYSSGGAGLLDRCSPSPSSVVPSAPPFLIRASTGGLPVPTLSRRHSITAAPSAAAAPSPLASLPSPSSHSHRVVVKVRVKKKKSPSMSHATMTSPSVGGGGGSIYLPHGPMAASTGSAGKTTTGPPMWQAPIAPMPTEPSNRKSSLKLTNDSVEQTRFSPPSPPPRPLPSALRRKSAKDAAVGSSSSHIVGGGGSNETSASGPRPPPPPSPTPASESRLAAQEMMSHQRVMPTNMDTIFA